MDFPDTWPGIETAAAVYLMTQAGALAPETQMALAATAALPPVDRLVARAEILYAVADAAGSPAQVLVAQMASFVVANFRHLTTDEEPQRGHRMIKAMRRRLGELDETQAPPAEDPGPRPEYVLAG